MSVISGGFLLRIYFAIFAQQTVSARLWNCFRCVAGSVCLSAISVESWCIRAPESLLSGFSVPFLVYRSDPVDFRSLSFDSIPSFFIQPLSICIYITSEIWRDVVKIVTRVTMYVGWEIYSRVQIFRVMTVIWLQNWLTGGSRTLAPAFLTASATPSTASIVGRSMQWRGWHWWSGK